MGSGDEEGEGVGVVVGWEGENDQGWGAAWQAVNRTAGLSKAWTDGVDHVCLDTVHSRRIRVATSDLAVRDNSSDGALQPVA